MPKLCPIAKTASKAFSSKPMNGDSSEQIEEA